MESYKYNPQTSHGLMVNAMVGPGLDENQGTVFANVHGPLLDSSNYDPSFFTTTRPFTFPNSVPYIDSNGMQESPIQGIVVQSRPNYLPQYDNALPDNHTSDNEPLIYLQGGSRLDPQSAKFNGDREPRQTKHNGATPPPTLQKSPPQKLVRRRSSPLPRPGRRGKLQCARCRRHKRGKKAPCVAPPDNPNGPCIPCIRAKLGHKCGPRTYPQRRPAPNTRVDSRGRIESVGEWIDIAEAELPDGTINSNGTFQTHDEPVQLSGPQALSVSENGTVMDSQESILDVSYQSHSDNNTGLQAPITTEEPPEKIEDQVVSLLLSNFGYNNRGLITQVVHDALLTLHTGTRQSQPVTTLLDDIPHTVSRREYQGNMSTSSTSSRPQIPTDVDIFLSTVCDSPSSDYFDGVPILNLRHP